MPSTLRLLYDHGQSAWLDDISRQLLDSGTLRTLVANGEVYGLTSNPTIFDKAIGESGDYDAPLRALVKAGQHGSAVYEGLVTRDIQDAADVLRPVYDATRGVDGRVSLEVSPELADDTAGTCEEARRLHREVGRENLFIKVPATRAGLPAITALIGDGISVNVTLIFGLQRYGEVMDAYLSGLEALARAGRPLDGVASVASFFVSRVDTLVDKLLEQRIAAAKDPGEQASLRALLGKAAVANARLAYEQFRKTFAGPRWEALRAKGARLQRPLWASTSTKNPAYSDVKYVDELIGPDTVNTMPLHTLEAFRDHGRVRDTIGEDLAGQREVFARLAAVGIDMEKVADQLEDEGVKSFAKSFEELAATIEQRAATIGVGA
jgi:transaldolase